VRQGVSGLRERVRQERYKRERTADGTSESRAASQQKRSKSAVGEEDFVAKKAQDRAEGWILTALLPPVLSFLGGLLVK